MDVKRDAFVSKDIYEPIMELALKKRNAQVTKCYVDIRKENMIDGRLLVAFQI